MTSDPAPLLWVFTYGSLMWSPNFTYATHQPARIWGWHRAMCILSNVYRGTPDCPGLVLGLDRGGSCHGRAYGIAPNQWPEVKQTIDERELVNGVYEPRWLGAQLADGTRVEAYGYVVRQDSPQYWQGPLTEAARIIVQGRGKNGAACDYLSQTLTSLRTMGVRDGRLEQLSAMVFPQLGG